LTSSIRLEEIDLKILTDVEPEARGGIQSIAAGRDEKKSPQTPFRTHETPFRARAIDRQERLIDFLTANGHNRLHVSPWP
jgi:hypothetical protein